LCAYFDSRASLLDRLYERGSGLRGAFEAWLYAPLRRRLELTLDELGDLSGQRVLDVGCGPGRYAVAAAERGAEVVGIDISPAMLMLAHGHAQDRSVVDACRFVQADFAVYEPDGEFDVALMMGVLEYLPDLAPPLTRLHALARERVIVSVPPRFGWRTMARRVRHGLRSAPPSFHPHSPAAVRSCLEETGFASCRVDRGWIAAYH
jgi:SAM-dependent methyltransferase